MTNLSETVARKSEEFRQEVDAKMAQWRQELGRLEQEIDKLSDEARATYQEKLAELKQSWQQVEAKFSAMTESDDESWNNNRTRWQETAVTYQKSFHQTANGIREIVPLGWLQGYTDIRTLESEGWAQGLGKRPSGSEGWAEGMGHKDEATSEGWAEGYNKTSNS